MNTLLFVFECCGSKIVKVERIKGMFPEVGSFVHIQSYKHDGSLHRTWSRGFVLESDEKHVVAVTDRAWVIESDGRKWLTREPAVCFFYNDKWFNVISMIRHAGIYYYVNLASPSVYDGEAIRNIDYDLDIKLYPDGGYSILDENEYDQHAKQMDYPDNIKAIVEKQLDLIIKMMEKGEDPFNQECIDYYYRLYLEKYNEYEHNERYTE